MKVILLAQVEKLGHVGSQVKVKPGYARNFLLPQKKALRATKEKLEHFEKEKTKILAANDAKKQDAAQIYQKINGRILNIIRLASEEGKLFGSVMPKDIALEIKKSFALEIKKSQIFLEKAIRESGIYECKVRIHADYLSVLNIVIARSLDEAKSLQAANKQAAKIASDEAAKAQPEASEKPITDSPQTKEDK